VLNSKMRIKCDIYEFTISLLGYPCHPLSFARHSTVKMVYIYARTQYSAPDVNVFKSQSISVKKGKGHPCTGTEALYRPYGP